MALGCLSYGAYIKRSTASVKDLKQQNSDIYVIKNNDVFLDSFPSL